MKFAVVFLIALAVTEASALPTEDSEPIFDWGNCLDQLVKYTIRKAVEGARGNLTAIADHAYNKMVEMGYSPNWIVTAVNVNHNKENVKYHGINGTYMSASFCVVLIDYTYIVEAVKVDLKK